MTEQKMSDRDALRLIDEVTGRISTDRNGHATLQQAVMKMAVLVAGEEKRQEERAKASAVDLGTVTQ